MQRLAMSPGTGERVLRFVGDRLTFTLHGAEGQPLPPGWRGMLRTNLGRGDVLRHEIIHAHTGQLKLSDAAWRDLALQPQGGGWTLDLPLTEVGYFRAKAYAMDEHGWQHWPEGYDVGISVHPSSYRTANTIYCAFVRMFGETKSAVQTAGDRLEPVLGALDKLGYTVIPPSGKFRDLIRSLPHILGTLGCRILHLLPVNPTPTVYAKFGRFGSPYALQDLLAIDPALVEFDQRTTGIDQFRELAYETHRLGGRLFLDVVINHTGWGSSLQENHPEWFLRDAQGNFVSPGAWGVTWEDLVELDHQQRELWEHLGDVFLEWCRRGVDGFRCDAGYKIPVPAWRYITARVLDEFPETVFLLEGLGGAWEATERLLTEGGMQWAYSELFQNYSGAEVARYLDYSSRQSERVGLYVHYSETHDNDRLAARGRAWSLLRNRLCALTSASGGFGFTGGVEWLASEKVQVHQSRGMAWDNPQNLLPELAGLNRLLATHPCFFDGATLRRLSPPESPVYALSRVSQEGRDRVLVLVNTDTEKAQRCALEEAEYQALGRPGIDLLGQSPPPMHPAGKERIEFSLEPATAFCLAVSPEPEGLSGDLYRERRAQAAWALEAVTKRFRAKDIGTYDWQAVAAQAAVDPRRFLAAVNHLDAEAVRRDLCGALGEALAAERYPQVVSWKLPDQRRILPVPAEHWLLVESDAAFRVLLQPAGTPHPQHLMSTRMLGAHVACFAPGQGVGEASLVLERYAEDEPHVEARVLFLAAQPGVGAAEPPVPAPDALVLLTNGLGGMARLRVDLGTVRSKYDCLLGANLHPSAPVDRHVFAKRVRVWVNADGFLEPLQHANLVEFEAGPPARARFVASAGDSRAVEIVLTADMLQGRNTTVLRFHRPAGALPFGRELPASARVHLVVRIDLEDRSFHAETHRNGGADHHFSTHSRPLDRGAGFEFTPTADRHLQVFSDRGQYHHEAEWSVGIPHPVEATRGQVAQGDGFSPGWFELPLGKGESVTLTVSADAPAPALEEIESFADQRRASLDRVVAGADWPVEDSFGRRLTRAVQAFVVRRGAGQTVIAGYPWFLDWGRDSLICARGLLAARMSDAVRDLLVLFGSLEEGGTLPNSIHGEDASNRDTSDAPLWFGMVCEELATLEGASTYQLPVGRDGRTIHEVLRGIAHGYRQGTPNGIRLDLESGLIWSPSHFTWMDTNFPACTPRQGYAVEIQALWIRLLRQLARLDGTGDRAGWAELASRAETSLLKLFWLEAKGYFADLLSAQPGQPATQAVVDDALRSNSLLVISLGFARGDRARRNVEHAMAHLLVPGAVRSLAPLPVSLPLVIRGADGRLLSPPTEPYRGRYEGDEDTRRKPAYHNGTAWTWLLPVFCEALAEAWDFHPTAVSAASSCLSSVEGLLVGGCLGQLPEIVDGDAPHLARGCDAQAWSITETLRVWARLRAEAQR